MSHVSTPSRIAVPLLVVAALVSGCVKKVPMPAVATDAVAAFAPAPRAVITRALETEGCVWVTDADKTLWFDDIGEAFLRKLIAERALVSPEAEGDVWATYEAKVAADRTAGYAWAVQVMAGMPEAELVKRARNFAAGWVPFKTFPAMRELVLAARASKCEVWLVSASNQWIVAAAGALLGIDADKIHGIRVEVQNGVLTDRVVQPITNAQGKVDLIEQLVKRTPNLVTGDSAGDYEMMAMAKGAVLISVPGAYDPAHVEKAKKSGWAIQEFSRR